MMSRKILRIPCSFASAMCRAPATRTLSASCGRPSNTNLHGRGISMGTRSGRTTDRRSRAGMADVIASSHCPSSALRSMMCVSGSSVARSGLKFPCPRPYQHPLARVPTTARTFFIVRSRWKIVRQRTSTRTVHSTSSARSSYVRSSAWKRSAMSRDSGSLSAAPGASGATCGSDGVNGVAADIGSTDGVTGVAGSSAPTLSACSSATNHAWGRASALTEEHRQGVETNDAALQEAQLRELLERREQLVLADRVLAKRSQLRLRLQAAQLCHLVRVRILCAPASTPVIYIRSKCLTNAARRSARSGAISPRCAHCAARTGAGSAFLLPAWTTTRFWKRSKQRW
jgi:hypothetical protein